MFDQTEKIEIIAKTFKGLEQLLANEIEEIGIKRSDIEIINRAVKYKGDLSAIYKSNFLLRTAVKILVPIHNFTAQNADELYKGIYQIDWSKYLNIHKTFSIDSVANSNYFKHSGFVSLKAKDAIVDQFRSKIGRRPSVNTQDPDLIIHIHISANRVTVSLDSSGEPLFKRGYRTATHKAPLNEVLAAALIKLSGWDSNTNFIDPMCGSGTIPIEAAMQALNIPAGINRLQYAFKLWNNFDNELWANIREEAGLNILTKKDLRGIQIIGSDVSETAVEAAKTNIRNLSLQNIIKIYNKDIYKFEPPQGKAIVITNPPYGQRLKKKNLNEFYQFLGNTLKNKYKDKTVWILAFNNETIKHIGLHSSQKITLYNGSLECKLLKYNIYEGSLKGRKKSV